MKLVLSPALRRHNGHKHNLDTTVVKSTAPKVETKTFDFHTVTWQADGFGFDATSGEFFTASATALLVMQALSDGLSRGQILDRITAAYDVTRRTAERDLESFLAELEHLGLQNGHN